MPRKKHGISKSRRKPGLSKFDTKKMPGRNINTKLAFLTAEALLLKYYSENPDEKKKQDAMAKMGNKYFLKG